MTNFNNRLPLLRSPSVNTLMLPDCSIIFAKPFSASRITVYALRPQCNSHRKRLPRSISTIVQPGEAEGGTFLSTLV